MAAEYNGSWRFRSKFPRWRVGLLKIPLGDFSQISRYRHIRHSLLTAGYP
jgi:hypothetical protein